MEGTLVKIDGFPHCTNCANAEKTANGWICQAYMWNGALIYPESVSMSWDWGLWRGDVWLGFIKQWGCQGYSPAEHHQLELTDKEREWARLVDELCRIEFWLDRCPSLGERHEQTDAQVNQLTEELQNNGSEPDGEVGTPGT